jgi:hypothetical protein
LGKRYHPLNVMAPFTLDEFYLLDDQIFLERKLFITERHGRERAFFDKNPWLTI